MNTLAKKQKQFDLVQEQGYDSPQQMIESIHIENFRCFKSLSLKGLGRFNILVGENGAGKTALLEAMFLAGGRHDLVFRLQGHRGMVQSAPVPVKEVYEALWRDLFFQFSQSDAIKIAISGSAENSRTLRILYKSHSESPILIGFQPGQPGMGTKPKTETSAIIPLTFETDVQGRTFSNNAVFNFVGGVQNNPMGGVGLMITGEPPPPAALGFLPTLAAYNLAPQFSTIDVRNEKAALITAIKSVFPIICDISVQSTPASVPDLYCTITEVKEKIPVALVSAGIQRFLAVLITIAFNRNGAVLVDEIENGIFHEKLPQAWRAIRQLCEVYNVQLFASTHSKECLNALAPILGENTNEFRLLRTEPKNGEGHDIKMFNGKDFAATLKVGSDPRQADLAVKSNA